MAYDQPPARRSALGLPSAERTLGIVLLCLFLASCSRAPEELLLQGSTMGTGYSIKLIAPPAELDLPQLQQELKQLLDQVNDAMSTYQADSELSRFNRSTSTDWVDASPRLLEVLTAAQGVSELSQGAFDISVGPLVNLWGFGPEKRPDEPPDEAEIERAQARVGYRMLELRPVPPALRKARPDLYLDLSAIAKGYAVDLLSRHLESRGLDNYMVEIGGEVWGRGHNRTGRPWRIAIEKPDPNNRSVQEIIELDGLGVATSGDYRNFFERDGHRYSHTIDPATGRPVTHNLASVTVLAESVMQADALATALLVLGPERGFALAERQGLAALFILRQGDNFQERATPAFAGYRLNKG